jgi:hypothetical protein
MRIGPYRLFFYSGDGAEPPHIHVERDQYVAKFWLEPVRLARSGGFGAAELDRGRNGEAAAGSFAGGLE